MIRLYTFLIFVAITAVILYVFFVMPQPNYVSKTSLLIIPKTEIVASNIDNVIDNLAFVAQNSLNNKEVFENDVVKIDVARLSNTSIIQFTTRTKFPTNIGNIENTVIKEAFIEISKYYDLNDDFAIKIVKREGMHKAKFSIVALYSVIVIAIIGLIAGILALFYMIDILKMRSEYNENINAKKIFADYKSDKQLYNTIDEDEVTIDNNRNIQKVSDDIEIIKDKIDKNNNINVDSESEVENEKNIEKETTLTTGSEMPEVLPTTPGNLPVVDVSDFGFKDDASSEKLIQEEKEMTEPTEEELKARLNELLNGKL